MHQLHPFNFKEEKRPDDKAIQELDLGEKDIKTQCQLKKSLYIIDGMERPDLYFKFMERFEFNILCQKEIKFQAILDTLLQLVHPSPIGQGQGGADYHLSS